MALSFLRAFVEIIQLQTVQEQLMGGRALAAGQAMPFPSILLAIDIFLARSGSMMCV